MIPRFSVIPISLAFVLSLLLGGCGGKTVVESDMGIKGAPDWVNEGTNILKAKDGRLFHGLGSAPLMEDMSLQTSAADNRARAEVARILSSYMNVVSKDYVASVGTGNMQASEQSVSRQIENITKLNLTGVKIIGHWRDKETGVIYSLAELDMKYMKDILNSAKDMNQSFKMYMENKGTNIFDRMAEGNR